MKFESVSITITRECPYCNEIVVAEIPVDKAGIDAVCGCGNHLWVSNVII